MNLTATSKEAIIKTCQNIVKEKGLTAINMRSVAKECNVAVGSIYNYFPSKSELLCGVIGSIWKDIFHMSGRQLDFSDFIECISWLFESVKKGSERYPDFFSMHALSFAAEGKAAGRLMMEQYFSHLKQSLLGVLEKDAKVREGAFNEILTPALFVDYIFTIFISSLMDTEQDCDGLLIIIKRYLY